MEAWAPRGWQSLAEFIDERGQNEYSDDWKRVPTKADYEAEAQRRFAATSLGERVVNGNSWQEMFGSFEPIGSLAALAASINTREQIMRQSWLKESVERSVKDRFQPLFAKVCADVRDMLFEGEMEAACQLQSGISQIDAQSFAGADADGWMQSGQRDGATIFVRSAVVSPDNEKRAHRPPLPYRDQCIFEVAGDISRAGGNRPRPARVIERIQEWLGEMGFPEVGNTTAKDWAQLILERADEIDEMRAGR